MTTSLPPIDPAPTPIPVDETKEEKGLPEKVPLSEASSTLRRPLKWALGGLLLAVLASWTFWMPALLPTLSDRIGLVSLSHIKELYLKTSLLEKEIHSFKGKQALLGAPSTVAALETASSASSHSILRNQMAAGLGLLLLKERFKNAKPYQDILPLLQLGFASVPQAAPSLEMLKKYAPTGVPSSESIQKTYAILKRSAESLINKESGNPSNFDWWEKAKAFFKKWISLEKNATLRMPQEDILDTLLTTTTYKDMLSVFSSTQSMPAEIKRELEQLTTFWEGYQALYLLESLLLKHLTKEIP